jgi:hypothetical protein
MKGPLPLRPAWARRLIHVFAIAAHHRPVHGGSAPDAKPVDEFEGAEL